MFKTYYKHTVSDLLENAKDLLETYQKDFKDLLETH